MAVRIDNENAIELFEQLCGREAVQILEHPIVRQNPNLIVWENNAQEPTTLARPFTALEHTRGGGAAMMAIGDVKMRQGGELSLDEADCGTVADHPGCVADAIRGGEIRCWGLRGFAS